MAQPPYIPPSDSGLRSWSINFTDLLTADPTAYGETAGSVAPVQALSDNWVAAYDTAINPATRTTPAVQAKDNARVQFVAAARVIGIRIRNNPVVSDQQRLDLGLTVPSAVPTPVPPPTSFPVMALVSSTPGEALLGYSDSASPTGKAKPEGSIGVQVWANFTAAGDPPNTNPETAAFWGVATKSPFTYTFDPNQASMTAVFLCRFTTRSGPAGVAQTGPWSAPLIVTAT